MPRRHSAAQANRLEPANPDRSTDVRLWPFALPHSAPRNRAATSSPIEHRCSAAPPADLAAASSLDRAPAGGRSRPPDEPYRPCWRSSARLIHRRAEAADLVCSQGRPVREPVRVGQQLMRHRLDPHRRSPAPIPWATPRLRRARRRQARRSQHLWMQQSGTS